MADRVTADLGDQYLTQDWADMNRSLFSALWLEKMAISITIGLIVMVAALNIIASLVLLVMEKSRDIAILKTMGASARSIMTIFMLQGLSSAWSAPPPGRPLGYTLAYFLDRYRLIRIPTDVYQVSHVPFTVLPWDFAVVDRVGHRHLLRRHDLSVTTGGAAGSGAGVAIRIGAARRRWALGDRRGHARQIDSTS